MSRFFFGRTGSTPPVVKNLIIINIVMYVALLLFYRYFDKDLNETLGLYYVQSSLFKPWQIITHMFMHSLRPFHIFLNMYALWIFGKTLESVWGSQRFLVYYLVTGLGAAFFHELVQAIELAPKIAALKAHYNFDTLTMDRLNYIYSSGGPFQDVVKKLVIHTVGASGAVYGVLLAFGMLFPNTPLFIIPIPVPIKAKWLVIGLGVIALYLGLSESGGNVAHFAHLGGMIFGFILIKVWNKYTRNFY